MTDTAHADNAAEAGEPPRLPRIYLVPVQDVPELRAAVRYAARRARQTGGKVALFYAASSAEFHHFGAISELMEQEARTEGERLLQRVAADVHRLSGHHPILYLRQGEMQEELLSLLAEEPGVSIVVLGAAQGPDGPGPIVSALGGRLAGRVDVPVAIIPEEMSDEDIDQSIS